MLRLSVREWGVFAELLVVELAELGVGKGCPTGVEGGGLMPLLSVTLLWALPAFCASVWRASLCLYLESRTPG